MYAFVRLVNFEARPIQEGVPCYNRIALSPARTQPSTRLCVRVSLTSLLSVTAVQHFARLFWMAEDLLLKRAFVPPRP